MFKDSVDPDRKLPISLKPDIYALTKSFAFGSKHKRGNEDKLTNAVGRAKVNYINFKRQNSGMKFGYQFY